jgi:competence ComEA-like helix-hairpin-helix protein
MPATTSSPGRAYDPSWRRHDLVGLIALCAAAAAVLMPAALPQRTPFDPARPADPGRVALAAENIDPNTASAASLRRLPNIGPVKARAIVAYRREHGPRPFPSPNDLARVHGIGPGIVEAVRPYLPPPP